MGEATTISWCEHTYNPWWGCTRVSPGCRNCYAETFSRRVGHSDAGSKAALWGDRAERRFFGDKHWAEPLKWDRIAGERGWPALVFCASMADVFEDRDDLVEHRERLFELIADTPNLIWLLLTKRPENVLRLSCRSWLGADGLGYVQVDSQHRVPVGYLARHELETAAAGRWPTNVWIGTTVEDQQRADERLPELVKIPGPVRFLSCEPLLEPVDLSRWLHLEWMDALRVPGDPLSFRGEGGWGLEMFAAVGGQRTAIDWIIAGGESGPGHRTMDLDWARDLRDQALTASVPYFFKQVSGPRAGTAGPPELDRLKGYPPIIV